MTNLSIIRSVVVPLAIFVTGLLAGVMLGVAREEPIAKDSLKGGKAERPETCGWSGWRRA
jgi:hypothetical protein